MNKILKIGINPYLFINRMIFAFLIGGTLSAKSEIVTGKVFKKDSAQKEILFDFKNTISDNNGMTMSEAQFMSPSGEVAVVEKSERQGINLKKYEIDHKQTGRKGSITVEGKKVFFNFEENGKKKSEVTEELKDNFVVGHTLVSYVSQHWKELLEGKKIDIRYGVWDRQETVGFSLFKTGEEKIEGQDVVLLKFKPSSFIIAALVDPVIFKFSADGKSLVGMVGRVAPKKKDGNSWKDLDAEVTYKTL